MITKRFPKIFFFYLVLLEELSSRGIPLDESRPRPSIPFIDQDPYLHCSSIKQLCIDLVAQTKTRFSLLDARLIGADLAIQGRFYTELISCFTPRELLEQLAADYPPMHNRSAPQDLNLKELVYLPLTNAIKNTFFVWYTSQKRALCDWRWSSLERLQLLLANTMRIDQKYADILQQGLMAVLSWRATNSKTETKVIEGFVYGLLPVCYYVLCRIAVAHANDDVVRFDALVVDEEQNVSLNRPIEQLLIALESIQTPRITQTPKVIVIESGKCSYPGCKEKAEPPRMRCATHRARHAEQQRLSRKRRKQQDGIMTCPECNKAYATRETLREHFRRMHTPNKGTGKES